MPKNILLTTASPPIASAKLKISDAHLSVDSLMEINFLRHPAFEARRRSVN